MNNEHRFEISNRIISVDQIKEISNYLQKTCNYYIDLFQKDKEKNNNAYIDASILCCNACIIAYKGGNR